MASQKPHTGFTRRQWVTLASVGGAGLALPISWPHAAQSIPVTIRYNRVRHIKNLIPDLVQSPEFFHQPHGEDFAAQLYRGLYNQQEPQQTNIQKIVRNLNRKGPEATIWSMVTSKKFHDIRRPWNWDHRFHVETTKRSSRDAAYLNSRLERLYEGLYGRRPTSFELTDDLRSLLVPVRTEQLLVSRVANGIRISTAYAQDAGDGGGWSITPSVEGVETSVTDGIHTITFNADKVLTTAILTEIALAGTLARVAAILVPLGISLFATAPLTSVAVTVIGTTIVLTALIPFGVALYQMGFDVPFLTLNSQPGTGGQPGAGQPGGDPSQPPPSDPPPSDPGPPPGASMSIDVSISDSPMGDAPPAGSEPGDPGDGGPGGEGAGTGEGDGGAAGDGDGGGDF